MARAGSRKHRARQDGRPIRVPDRLRREDELVTETHALDGALGVRNRILARLTDHLTAEERQELSEYPRQPYDVDRAAQDLREWNAYLARQNVGRIGKGGP